MRKLFAGIILAASVVLGPALAEELDIPVMVWAADDLATCSFGVVTGLDPSGDNFLAVRAGPGSGHRMLNKINTNDEVWIFDENNGWFGIAYGSPDINCSPASADRPYIGPGKTGWVFGKYVKIIAG
ncbi:SH3 domain-containing protein [Hoeflea prorocentri]|uniref:SH3 domain-containing protein n=1 Tax=Hoeflea prorocentri TaxID=1922333 RepID=A0A9X3ZH91_9HYPH|nr:SH3 domain-containing protein [Hoeflea prorocentri]MCY6381059.1 SH3 domain-containing protein [Hoeflea prorocentri]MDA5398859.1 SH3 domain-containing protein [Hoeflea prorocentri]